MKTTDTINLNAPSFGAQPDSRQVFDTEEIKARISVREYLESIGVDLQKSGSNYISLCPMHREKHGSFVVFPDDHWTCFGACGESGDLISLVMMLKGVGFVEACESLGAIARPGEFTPRKGIKLKDEPDYLAENVARRLKSILVDYDLPNWRIKWEELSRFDTRSADWKTFLSAMFCSEDVVWIGEPTDSNDPDKNAGNFRTVRGWLNAPVPLGWRIASSTFKAGSYQRRGERVVATPWRVLECDDLIGFKASTPEDRERNKRASSALISWLQERIGIHVGAIIESGGKSLHAWCHMDERTEAELRRLDEVLRIDKAWKNAAHPWQLPGCIHEKTGIHSRILFLAGRREA